MSDASKTIHELLVTLSHVELCGVIARSAELCAGFSLKKKPSIAPVAPVAPKPVVEPVPKPAPVPTPKPSPTSVPASVPTSVPAPKPRKSFAELLGWTDSEEDPADDLQRQYDVDEFRENDSDESNAESVESRVENLVKKCRDMTKCFTHGQRIRHTVSDKVRMGTYDSAKNAIVHNGIAYSTLTKFATAHVLTEHNPSRATKRDGWKHCTCEVQGKWVSTYNLSGY